MLLVVSWRTNKASVKHRFKLAAYWMQLFCILLLFSNSACSSEQTPTPQTFTIAVAANAYNALQAVATAYAKEQAVDIHVVKASSGKLAAQIAHGAPYALFFSADEHYPQYLHHNKHANTPQLYAIGQLCFWQKDKKKAAIEDLLLQAKTIAIANKDTAPYGQAAYEYLTNKQLIEQVKNKLVYAENIAQINNYIQTQAVDIAFTSLSSLSLLDSSQHTAIQTIQTTTTIQQAMCITQYGTTHFEEISKQFANFVLSKKGQDILNTYHYQSPYSKQH